MTMIRSFSSSALLLAATSSLALAQQAAPARGPAMALALEAAQTAVNTCTANGTKVTAAVVDSGGVVRVQLTADGASAQSVEFATKKAFTANALKAATSAMAQKMKSDPALAAKLNADTSLRVRPGGVPLMAGNDVIGAIGVGGSPTANGVAGGVRDAMCAQAGADKIKDRLK
jgi:uncharacterized protein GlcG (DUF336 family)